jgi:hypothetical protein
MEKRKSFYHRCCKAVDIAFETLSALIIGLSALAICIQVVGRSFGLTFGIFEEGPRLFFCYAVLPMLGILYRRGRHINVEILPNQLNGANWYSPIDAPYRRSIFSWRQRLGNPGSLCIECSGRGARTLPVYPDVVRTHWSRDSTLLFHRRHGPALSQC